MTAAYEGPFVQLRGITRIYGEGRGAVRALDSVDLDVQSGDFLALMGPSGSGKSTALNVIGCLDEPTEGSYLYRGVEVTALTRQQRSLLRRAWLGFVFQSFNLLSRLSAVENVELPLVYRGVGRKERTRLATEALATLGLADRAGHRPNMLSGGEQQRVALARALVSNPAVLLADEPTGNLDSKRSLAIAKILRDLNEQRGITILMVTHEPPIAAFARSIVRFQDGRVVGVEPTGGAP